MLCGVGVCKAWGRGVGGSVLCGVWVWEAVCYWVRGVLGSMSHGMGVWAAWGKEADLKGRSC